MKQTFARFAWLFLAYMALLTSVAALMYILGDPRDFKDFFREKYIEHLALVRFHGICGALALALGPLQLWPWFRSRFPIAHRWAGRLYVLGVAGGAASGFRMGLMAFGGTASQVAFSVVALAWLWTGWKAYDTARHRRLVEHRIWMLRNYALTFGAVSLRVLLISLQLAGLDFVAIYPYVSWLAWLPGLLLAEILIHPSATSTAFPRPSRAWPTRSA